MTIELPPDKKKKEFNQLFDESKLKKNRINVISSYVSKLEER